MSEVSVFDLARLRDETGLQTIDFHWELGSTNTQAAELLAQPNSPPLPLLVLAERQTAGRGRGQNVWWSAAGSLTCSLVVPLEPLPPERLPQLSLTVGLALCQAIEAFAPLVDLAIKWPNDVYLNERKLAGILIELPPQRPPVAIIGFGINGNNSSRGADPALASRCTSLLDSLGHEVPLTDLLIACLQQIDARWCQLQTDPSGLVDQWRAYHMLPGRDVTLDVYGRVVSGTCLDLDDDGALLVETQAGVERCVGGVVTGFGPPATGPYPPES